MQTIRRMEPREGITSLERVGHQKCSPQELFFQGGTTLVTTQQGVVEGMVLFRLLREAYAERSSAHLQVCGSREEFRACIDHGKIRAAIPDVAASDLGMKIVDCLYWSKASFRLDPGKCEIRDGEGRSIPNVIMDAVRHIQDDKFITGQVGTGRQIIALSADPFYRFQKLELSPQEAYVLSRIDRATSIEDLCRISAFEERVTLRALLAFLATGVIERVDDSRKEHVSAQEIRPDILADQERQASGEEAHLLKEVSATLSRFVRSNYFQILDVGPNATSAELKHSYFSLAKRFHPDKFYFAKTARLAEEGGRLFALVTKAYQTLSHPDQRDRYLNELKANSGASPGQRSDQKSTRSPEKTSPNGGLTATRTRILRTHGKSIVAEKRFQSAKMAIQRSELAVALEHLREAVRLEPNVAVYQYQLGRILAKIPSRYAEAAERLQLAVQVEPRNWEYHYALGRLYRQQGESERAEKELRLANELKKEEFTPAPKSAKKSFIARLFRKGN